MVVYDVGRDAHGVGGILSSTDDVWSEQDTTPADISAALRELLTQRHAETEAFVPARVLNLVVIVDREWRGEIQNRLDRVGSYHASRTILCSVEEGRSTIDGWASMTAEEDLSEGELAVAHEQVVIDIGPRHLQNLDTIVDPILKGWQSSAEPVATYAAGSQGPAEADRLLAKGHRWRAI